jgi:hypothetical protein
VDRALLVDRVVHGLDYSTLAARYGLPLAATYKRVPRLLQRLRAMLRSSGAFAAAPLLRLRGAARQTRRSVMSLPAVSQAFVVALLVVTAVVVAPFDAGRWRDAGPGWDRGTATVTTATTTTAATGAGVQLQDGPRRQRQAATPPLIAPQLIRTTEPLLPTQRRPCVEVGDGRCGHDGQDVLTVRVLPGAPPVIAGQNWVHACAYLNRVEPPAAQRNVQCRTEGDPDYVDPPPPGGG